MLFISINHLPKIQTTPLELRLDLFEKIDWDCLEAFLKGASLPILVTAKKDLPAIGAPFVDLPWDQEVSFPAKRIRSHHDFEKTPADLDTLFSLMQTYPADLYKIAAFANSTSDALRLLLFKKKHPTLFVIPMGPKGSFARILGPVVGNALGFSYLKSGPKTASGQIAAIDLQRIYNYNSLSSKTALYGLIGNPVEKSQGHLYHNAVFRKKKRDAVYVKIPLEPHELAPFFDLSRQIGFQGLSVTSPLKEAVLPFLDTIDSEAEAIGAVNTVRFQNGKLFGCNTDGKAALDALEQRGSIEGKKLILLGAGGAARAIAFEAIKRKANVWILNRTKSKAAAIAKKMGAESGGLDEMPSNYDILVNTTPFIPKHISSSALVMDVVYKPNMTSFLKQAKRLGCAIVYGKEMFLRQAAAQSALWDTL